ncbi:MAG: hypothetical protein HYX53_11090 [Chloroflexi bacterium]|nr:hypothetical protein [Chloroflexota bacterium]
MLLSDIAERLAELAESPGFSVARFDDGDPFAGRVAVLPSAYNPPTRAHTSLLEVGAATEGVSAAAALLSTTNVDKQLFGAPLSHRVGMLLAARSAEPGLAVLSTNAARFADQAEALRIQYGRVEFDFIAGFDTLVRIFDERYYQDMPATLDRFFAAHRLIATNRAQATIDAVREFVDQPRVRPYRARIIVRELDPHPASLSSTQARQHAERGDHPPAVLPAVAAYIREHGLYAASPEA